MSTGFKIFCLGITGLAITIIFILISISKKEKKTSLVQNNYNFNLENKNQLEDYNDETVSLVDDIIKENKQQPSSIFTSKYSNSAVTLKKYEEKPLEQEKYLEPEPFNKITYEDDKTESLIDVVNELKVEEYSQENKVKARFCTNCGFKSEEDYKFCTNCGHKITI